MVWSPDVTLVYLGQAWCPVILLLPVLATGCHVVNITVSVFSNVVCNVVSTRHCSGELVTELNPTKTSNVCVRVCVRVSACVRVVYCSHSGDGSWLTAALRLHACACMYTHMPSLRRGLACTHLGSSATKSVLYLPQRHNHVIRDPATAAVSVY